MDFRVFDKNFEVVGLVESYESMIWTSRFSEAGEFELYTPVTDELISVMKNGYYIFSDQFYDKKKDQAELMIIDTVEIESDAESGSKIKVTGKDLKTILSYRIVWGQRAFKVSDKETVKSIITAVVNENLINPTDWSKTYQDSDTGSVTVKATGAKRKISNFELSFKDEDWESITEDVQYNGETLYDVIASLSENFKFGYKVVYDFTDGKIKMTVSHRRDRTYDQITYPPLIFSPNFENIRNSNFLESSANEKTTALITGEGDEHNVMYNVIGDELDGLNRKETNISASDVNRTTDDGTEYGNKTYLGMLMSKGEADLKTEEYSYIKAYEGTAEDITGYKYLKDYEVGDICEIINEWQISSKTLISEVVLSISTSGITIIPTFASIKEDEKGGN